VVLPGDNRKDFDDLLPVVKDGVKVHFAETYADVFGIAFPELNNVTGSEGEDRED